ncbi:respiratory nitrate reductase subunit gamma [Aestuariivirga sp.]|uniref:respiratory nitrate reductase subunit gamma n=1 Tax=Aestuariivirga sp. TaxID=2650926 RepID=UPI00391CEB71
MRDTLFHILFVWYPYVCLSSFIFGSLIRFDREQYTWKASSSQLLRKRQLFWGSNLFHFGILFLLLGHTVGLLTPTSVYTLFITVEQKQLIAITAGGIAGVVCFVGLTLLLHRRLFDDRIRQTSTYMDLAILIILWVQLSLGLLTLPFSFAHSDGEVMLKLSHWAQGILTVQPVDAKTLQGLDWPYLVHLVLGMTIFLLFPYSRLVHIWSAPVWYLGRKGYQVVRRRPMETSYVRKSL